MAGTSKGALGWSLILHFGLLCVLQKWLPVAGGHAGRGDRGDKGFPDDAPGPRFVETAVDPPMAPLPDEPPAVAVPTALPLASIIPASLTPPWLDAPTAAPEPRSAHTAPVPDRSRRADRRPPWSSHGKSGGRQGLPVRAGQGGEPGFSPPKVRLQYRPRYPADALAQRLEGIVLLRVEVGADGQMTNVSIQEGCGHPALDRAALASVRSWRFDPARRDGAAVAALVEIPIRFRLEPSPANRI